MIDPAQRPTNVAAPATEGESQRTVTTDSARTNESQPVAPVKRTVRSTVAPPADGRSDHYAGTEDEWSRFQELLDQIFGRADVDPSDYSSFVRGRLRALAEDRPAFLRFLVTIYGRDIDPQAVAGLLRQIRNGDFGFLPEIRVVGSDVLGDANGAYDAANQIIYLHEKLTRREAAAVYAEEVGHHLDTLLGHGDAAGDEGELFRRLLTGEHLSVDALQRIGDQDDHGEIVVDGQRIAVEFDGDEDSGAPVRKVAPNGQRYLANPNGTNFALSDAGTLLMDRDADGNETRIQIDPATGLVLGATVKTLEYADGTTFHYIEHSETGNFLETDAAGKLRTTGNKVLRVDPSSVTNTFQITLSDGRIGTLDEAAEEVVDTLIGDRFSGDISRQQRLEIARSAILAVGDQNAGQPNDGILGKVNIKIDLQKITIQLAKNFGKQYGKIIGEELGLGDTLSKLFEKIYENLADPKKSPFEGTDDEFKKLAEAAASRIGSAGVPAELAGPAAQAIARVIVIAGRKAVGDYNTTFGTSFSDDLGSTLSGEFGKTLGGLVATGLGVDAESPRRKAIVEGFQAAMQHAFGFGQEDLVLEEGWDDVGQSGALTLNTIRLVINGVEKVGEELVEELLNLIFDGKLPNNIPPVVADLVRTAIVETFGALGKTGLETLFDVKTDLFKNIKGDIAGAFGNYLGSRLGEDFGPDFARAVGTFYETMFRNVALGRDAYADLDKAVVETMVKELVKRLGDALPNSDLAEIFSAALGSVLGTFASSALSDYANTFSDANIELAGKNAAAAVAGVLGRIAGRELAKLFPEESRPLLEQAAQIGAKKAAEHFLGLGKGGNSGESGTPVFETVGTVVALAIQFALGGKEISDGYVGTGTGRVTGAIIGAYVGSFFPGGTAIGAAIGALIGSLFGSGADGKKMREDLAGALAEQLGEPIVQHQQSSFYAGRNLGSILYRVLQSKDGGASGLLNEIINGLEKTVDPELLKLTDDKLMSLDERARDELFDAAYSQLFARRDPQATDNKVAYLLLREAGEFTSAGLLSALKEARSKGQAPPIVTVVTDKPQTPPPTGPEQKDLPTYEHTGIHAQFARIIDAADGKLDGNLTLIDTRNGNIVLDKELRDHARARAEAEFQRLLAQIGDPDDGTMLSERYRAYAQAKLRPLVESAIRMVGWELEHEDGLNDGFIELKYLSNERLAHLFDRVGEITHSQYAGRRETARTTSQTHWRGNFGIFVEEEQRRLDEFNSAPNAGLYAWFNGTSTIYFDVRTFEVVHVELGMRFDHDQATEIAEQEATIAV